MSEIVIQQTKSGYSQISGIDSILVSDGGSNGTYVQAIHSSGEKEYAYIWEKRNMMYGCYTDISIRKLTAEDIQNAIIKQKKMKMLYEK